ncbi:hypothetical protein ACTOB_000274 [Actinoplanes oblitus]|uniref:Type II secretion system protein GspF domain-containing protein n=1 Tax=Actinoplanes oblitus TaxID=3040509 RepID=A0ABY8WIU8_9ACTN|nr:hypothetical protein [Actinoplanes oblitus]WIM96807.1 hypothetical protein ACTOB_000274 [Actinoplanes oblitus]
MIWVLPVVCLLGCAVVIVWPGRGVLDRLVRRRARPVFAGRGRLRMPVLRGRRAVLGAAASAAVLGLLLGGPVAAMIGAVYSGLGTHAWERHQARRQVVACRAASVDRMAAMVADLRAGLPPALVTASVAASGIAGSPRTGPLAGDAAGRLVADPRLARLAEAVWALAEQTGAPAADLLDRIEADARLAGRATAAADAQAAGVRMTAGLLVALPLAGIPMGYGIGVDPVRILLHTPLGAASAVGALLLQCGGLWLTRWLMDGVR